MFLQASDEGRIPLFLPAEQIQRNLHFRLQRHGRDSEVLGKGDRPKRIPFPALNQRHHGVDVVSTQYAGQADSVPRTELLHLPIVSRVHRPADRGFSVQNTNRQTCLPAERIRPGHQDTLRFPEQREHGDTVDQSGQLAVIDPLDRDVQAAGSYGIGEVFVHVRNHAEADIRITVYKTDDRLKQTVRACPQAKTDPGSTPGHLLQNRTAVFKVFPDPNNGFRFPTETFSRLREFGSACSPAEQGTAQLCLQRFHLLRKRRL